MEIKRFVIYGEPMGKQRPHPYSTPNGAREFTPHKTVQFENLVKMEYHAQCGGYYFPDGEPVYILIDCFMKAPKASKKKTAAMLSHILRPLRKVDWDNAGKIICDALNKIAYKDDSQVVDGRVRKWWSKRPRVIVNISNEPFDMSKYHIKPEEQEEET